MPFGQYRQLPLSVLAGDPGYVAWLLAQDWVPERFPELHAYLTTLGIAAKEMCRETTKTGDACTFWAKYGRLCGHHYRQAELANTRASAGQQVSA